MARFRIATLNMAQDHKRWEARRELIAGQLVELKPDVLALNEVCVPLQTARWVQSVAKERMSTDYALVQQTKVNSLAVIEAEALLTRFLLMETGNGPMHRLHLGLRTREDHRQRRLLRQGECR